MRKIFAIMALFLVSMTSIFAVDNCIPNVEFNCTKDFSGTNPDKAIHVGDEFFITFTFSMRITGIFSQAFGPKRIPCVIGFKYPLIVEESVEDQTIAVSDLPEAPTYKGYSVNIPASADGSQKSVVTFRCRAVEAGVQEIRIAFHDIVSSDYQIIKKMRVYE